MIYRFRRSRNIDKFANGVSKFMNEARAKASFIRVSPRKARGVIDLIRGRSVEEALTVLSLTRKKAAHPLKKLLVSAMANATVKNQSKPEDLFVSKAFVDEGPTLKRFRARAMGRATKINKRTSHITIILAEREKKVEDKKSADKKTEAPGRKGVFARRFRKKKDTG